MNRKLLYFALRLALVIWIVAAAASLWFSYAEAAEANNGPRPKVTICHILTNPPTTTRVPAGAVQAHLAHGDYLGDCQVEPTPTDTPTPTPEPTATPEPPGTAPEPATGVLWLLTNQIGGVNQHCLLFAESHPSIERQGARCWPELFDGSWVASNAPCAAPVFSRWPGDDDGFWPCDSKTPWRLPLETLRGIYERHLSRGR